MIQVSRLFRKIRSKRGNQLKWSWFTKYLAWSDSKHVQKQKHKIGPQLSPLGNLDTKEMMQTIKYLLCHQTKAD
jgi:hypothetical protein